MIDVITLDREYGAGGSEIARKLGDRLGWTVWDERLTLEIALRMDCDGDAVRQREERQDPLYYRMAKAFFRGSAEGVHQSAQMKVVDADCIREMSEKVVREAAARGRVIIVGRGSAHYLRDRPNSFHLFVHAPLAERIRRLELRGERADTAAELAETVDRDRAAFIRRYFAREWPDRHLYHLTIDSSIGDEAVVRTVLGAIAIVEESKP